MTVDHRTDRRHLTTESYGDARRLLARQQLYRFSRPPDGEPTGPITDWLFGLAGGPAALPMPVVDVGAGNGNYLRALAELDPLGFDLSLGMLRDARSEGCEGPLAVSDVQALPLRSGTVGTAMANHMLYHVPDIALGVAELRRVVRGDGLLLAVTNGAGHVGEIDAAIRVAVDRLSGEKGFTLDRSGLRFTLEDGDEVLRRSFSTVSVHHRRTQLVVPEPQPVVDYIESMQALEGTLPTGVAFADVLEICREHVTDVIAREGAFVVSVHAGAFVCRP